MKRISLNFFSLLLVALIGAGCVHLPAVSNPPGALNGGAVLATAPLVQASQSESKQAIQRTVNWLAVLCTLAGVGLLVLAGFLGYAGQVIPAVKTGLAGLLLPIFGVWFAYHWLGVVIVALLSLAGVFLAAHHAFVKPVLERLENIVEKKA